MQTTKIGITNNQTSPAKKKIWKNPVRDTGYAAVVLGATSVIAANRKKINLHKYLAWAAGLLSAVHIGIVEYYKHKSKTNTQK